MSSDPCKPPPDPFQPFGVEAADPFASKKTLGDPFSGKDPFAPFSATSKRPSFSAVGMFIECTALMYTTPLPSYESRHCFLRGV
jgi:hypothetical protein